MIDNVEFVRSLYDAFKAGDIAYILGACDPEVDWRSNADPNVIPWGGKRKGIQQAKQFFTAIAEHVEFEVFEPRLFFGGEDSVAVIGRMVAHMKPSGGVFRSEWAHIFAFFDGKITYFREFSDTHALVAAFRGEAAPDRTRAGDLASESDLL